MDLKAAKGHQYSYAEMSLLAVARPYPIFEHACWFDEKNKCRNLSFHMCDCGRELGDPLLVEGPRRVDVINGKTGKILYKDCGNGWFSLISPESMLPRLGSAVAGPEVKLSEEMYKKIADQSPCCLVRNVVFTNGIVDTVVGKFLCPVTPFVEKKYKSRTREEIYLSAETEIYFKDVSYRFSEKIEKLSLEAKKRLIYGHPDVESKKLEVRVASISKNTCPDASTFYCSEQLKQAFERGETVEAAVIMASFVDNKAYSAEKDSYSFEATVTCLNRNIENSDWGVISRKTGPIDKSGRFSFEVAVVLWASKKEAEKAWESFGIIDLNASLELKVRNGNATEFLKGMLTDDGFPIELMEKELWPVSEGNGNQGKENN